MMINQSALLIFIDKTGQYSQPPVLLPGPDYGGRSFLISIIGDTAAVEEIAGKGQKLSDFHFFDAPDRGITCGREILQQPGNFCLSWFSVFVLCIIVFVPYIVIRMI